MIYSRPPTPWLKKSKKTRRSFFSLVFLRPSQEFDKIMLNKDTSSEPALPSSPLTSNTFQVECVNSDESPQPQSYTPIFAFIDEYFQDDAYFQQTPSTKNFSNTHEKSGFNFDNRERSYFSDDSSDSSDDDDVTRFDEVDSFSSSSDNHEVLMDPYLPTSEAQYKLRMRIYYEQKLRTLSVHHNPAIGNVMEWIKSVNA